jgi:YVTN family beta-propeller protein
MVFNARPPFDVIKAIDTGPITNHVNIVRNVVGQFAYVTVGGLNMVKVFKTDTFELVATIPTGALPHGLWPSGDGTRLYVGLENADGAAVIDTLENKVIDTIAIGQAPQGVAYVSNAVPEGGGTQNLQPLGVGAELVQLTLTGKDAKPATQVTLFDQGLVQVLQAAVTGLPPKQPFVLALSDDPKGAGRLEPLAGFMTNPAGRRHRQYNRPHPAGHAKHRRNAEAVSRYRCRHTGAVGRAGASANAAMRRGRWQVCPGWNSA